MKKKQRKKKRLKENENLPIELSLFYYSSPVSQMIVTMHIAYNMRNQLFHR